MSLILTANKIESPGLLGDNTAQRRGDGSFDDELQTAKKKLLIAPWGEIQKMFNLTPLEFKFDLSVNKIQDEVKKDTPEPQTAKAERAKPDEVKEAKAENPPQNAAPIKVTKEILAKNTPLPVIPFAMANSGLANGQETKSVSKSDLKMMIDEIVEKIELMKIGRRSELNLALSYENSGDMMLKLILKNGLVTVQIAAAQPETRRSLEDNLSELESALKSAKINLKDIKIMEANNGDHARARS